MRKRDLFIVTVVALSFGLPAAYGLDAAAPKAAAIKTAATKAAEMTKDQMLAKLKESIASTDEIFEVIKELRTVISKDGKISYTYNGIALDSISKEDMAKLFSRVRQALVKIRTDRIQKQLEITRKVERLQSAADVRQPSRLPASPPSLPKSPPSLPPALRRR